MKQRQIFKWVASLSVFYCDVSLKQLWSQIFGMSWCSVSYKSASLEWNRLKTLYKMFLQGEPGHSDICSPIVYNYQCIYIMSSSVNSLPCSLSFFYFHKNIFVFLNTDSYSKSMRMLWGSPESVQRWLLYSSCFSSGAGADPGSPGCLARPSSFSGGFAPLDWSFSTMSSP